LAAFSFSTILKTNYFQPCQYGSIKEQMNQVFIEGDKICIDTKYTSAIEVNHVFEFEKPEPFIFVFEGEVLKRQYRIEALTENPNLTGQYFHSSIRVLNNGALMIDGVISKDKINPLQWGEGIRLQPFFLSPKDLENQKLRGKGLFQRGLHFSGTVTPSNVRVVCICDNCSMSFTLQHFHAGFADAQYFYSSDSKQTLVVHWYQIKNMPTQMQKDINLSVLNKVEAHLPKPTKGSGSYKYYNSFRCPHCGDAFIDFESNKNLRPFECYANKLINHETQHIDK
jgi:hypothetical protein